MEACLELFIDAEHSRIPVFDGEAENIIGVVYSKEFLSVLRDRELVILRDVMRRPYFVAAEMKVVDLLREFRRGEAHLALVRDAGGPVAGLVTLRDLLEEIVGEIPGEYEGAGPLLEAVFQGGWLADARVSMRRLGTNLGLDMSTDVENTSLNVFLRRIARRLPQAGEILDFGPLRFTIKEASARRISKVLVETGGSLKGGK